MENSSHPKSKTHALVGVHFLDHSECQGKDPNSSSDGEKICLTSCYVVGFLEKETELAYQITSWITDSDFCDWNTRTDCILKSTLLRPIEVLANVVNKKGLPE